MSTVQIPRYRLECHNRTSRVRTVTAKAVAGKSGEYKLVADGDHEEEICQLQLVESSNPEGDVLLEGAVHNGRVALTKKNGLRTSPP
ncbi:hypothetical protein NL676_027151 [Syzygium grande]|nr:hypothetical protein NL676_027151 [Syzygium grande]